MNNEQLHRDLGRVEGSLTALTAKVDDMALKLDNVLKHHNRRVGAAVLGSTILSAVIAFATAWYTR